MAPTEKSTYFGYNEGYDPIRLRLGTMVFDYANPKDKRPYIHPDVKELLTEPPLATADIRPICAMSQMRGRSCAFGGGLKGLLDFDHSKSNATYRLVVGKMGSKVELLDPYKFFELNVLREETARIWLESKLSVANDFMRYKNWVAAPKIWLLTGIYLMEDATTYTISSKSSLNAASLTIPIPEPTGLAALVGAAAGTRFSLSKDFVGEAGAEISGKKVWAARWQQVNAKFVCIKRANWDAEALGKLLEMTDLNSLGGERGDTDEIELAEVGLAEDRVILNDGVIGESGGVENDCDEVTWERFEKNVDELLAEWGCSDPSTTNN